MPRLLLAILLSFAVTDAASSSELSRISVPITYSLSGLEDFANQQLPVTLSSGERGQRCVEPEKACTKIPEFRDLRMTMRNRCVEVTPAIDCTISQKTWREGRLRISGNGDALVLQQIVRGTATVRGRGEIGRHIRETANGAAELTVTIRPAIKSDWSVSLPFTHSISWIQPPTARLFNIFPVTFRGEAEKALNKSIADFKAKRLPHELSKINLKGNAARAWNALQRPIPIPISNGVVLYLHIDPVAIAAKPLNVSQGQVRSALSISANIRVTDSATRPFRASRSLPALTSRFGSEGVSVNIPVRLSTQAINRQLSGKLPKRLEFDDPFPGVAEVKTARLSDSAGRLALELEIDIRRKTEAPVPVKLNISAQPVLDTSKQAVILADPDFSYEVDGPSGILLDLYFAIPGNKERLLRTLSFDLRPKLGELTRAANAALNKRDGYNFFKLNGEVKFTARDLSARGGLRLVLGLEGHIGHAAVAVR